METGWAKTPGLLCCARAPLQREQRSLGRIRVQRFGIRFQLLVRWRDGRPSRRRASFSPIPVKNSPSLLTKFSQSLTLRPRTFRLILNASHVDLLTSWYVCSQGFTIGLEVKLRQNPESHISSSPFYDYSSLTWTSTLPQCGYLQLLLKILSRSSPCSSKSETHCNFHFVSKFVSLSSELHLDAFLLSIYVFHNKKVFPCFICTFARWMIDRIFYVFVSDYWLQDQEYLSFFSDLCSCKAVGKLWIIIRFYHTRIDLSSPFFSICLAQYTKL